jgi:hypothetical protein
MTNDALEENEIVEVKTKPRDTKILSVDEFGVTLGTKQNFPKGLRLEISCPQFKEIFGTKVIGVQVEKNSLDANTGSYRTYAAYNPNDAKLFRDVKKWLVKNAA